MRFRLMRKAFSWLGAPTSVDDVTDLLNNSLLVSALMLAFTVTLATGTFSHEDLVAADTRYAQLIAGKRGLPRFLNTTSVGEDGADLYPDNIISVRFIWEAVEVATELTIALAISMLTYVSLAFSDAREDSEFFTRWFKLWRFPIAGAYLLVLHAIVRFANLNHTAIDIAYPYYNVDQALEDGTFVSDPWLSGKAVHEKSAEHFRTHPHQAVTYAVKRFQIDMIITLATAAVVVHMITYFWHYCVTGTSETMNLAMDKLKLSAHKDDPGVIKDLNANKLKAAGIDAELMKDTHDLLLDAALKDAGIDKPGDRLRLIRDAREGRLSADM